MHAPALLEGDRQSCVIWYKVSGNRLGHQPPRRPTLLGKPVEHIAIGNDQAGIGFVNPHQFPYPRRACGQVCDVG
jgi:hypothetical protein